MQRRDFYSRQDSTYSWGQGRGCDWDAAHRGTSAVGGNVLFQLVGGYKGGSSNSNSFSHAFTKCDAVFFFSDKKDFKASPLDRACSWIHSKNSYYTCQALCTKRRKGLVCQGVRMLTEDMRTRGLLSLLIGELFTFYKCRITGFRGCAGLHLLPSGLLCWASQEQLEKPWWKKMRSTVWERQQRWVCPGPRGPRKQNHCAKEYPQSWLRATEREIGGLHLNADCTLDFLGDLEQLTQLLWTSVPPTVNEDNK